MNPDEIKSLIVKLLIMMLTAVATALHMNADATLTAQIPALAADLADLGTLGYGVYLHWNMKKVPETATMVGAPKALLAAAFVILGAFALGLGAPYARADSSDLIAGLKKHPLVAPPTPGVLTGNPVADITTAITNGEASLTSALQPLIAFVTSDFASAQALAVSAGDGNGAACWAAMKPIATLIQAHPLPATLHLATDFQALRSLQIAIKQLCENSACTQVFGEEANQIAAFGLGIPIPSLSAACAKITPIALVPGGGVATPVPIATPALTAPTTVAPVSTPSPTPTAQ